MSMYQTKFEDRSHNLKGTNFEEIGDKKRVFWAKMMVHMNKRLMKHETISGESSPLTNERIECSASTHRMSDVLISKVDLAKNCQEQTVQ